MKQIIILAVLFIVVSCGKQEHEIALKAPEKDLISGESYSYVIVKLEFIQQMRDICTDLYLQSNFATYELYKQQVAQCTLDNLSILDLGALEQFNTDICNDPKTSEEIQICEAIN